MEFSTEKNRTENCYRTISTQCRPQKQPQKIHFEHRQFSRFEYSLVLWIWHEVTIWFKNARGEQKAAATAAAPTKPNQYMAIGIDLSGSKLIFFSFSTKIQQQKINTFKPIDIKTVNRFMFFFHWLTCELMA